VNATLHVKHAPNFATVRNTFVSIINLVKNVLSDLENYIITAEGIKENIFNYVHGVICLKRNLIKSRIGGITIKYYVTIAGTSYKQKKRDVNYVVTVHAERMNAYVLIIYVEHVRNCQHLNKLKAL